VGGPDPVTGEAINAFVILRLGFDPTPELGEELRKHVATKISPIAKPKTLMFTRICPRPAVARSCAGSCGTSRRAASSRYDDARGLRGRGDDPGEQLQVRGMTGCP